MPQYLGAHGRWSFGILMYELLYGFTPFRGAKRDTTFENILKRPLAFPSSPEISSDCQARPCPLQGCYECTECAEQGETRMEGFSSGLTVAKLG